MMSTILDSSTPVPDTLEEWQAQVDLLGLSTKTIHDIQLKSASRVSREQFLLLRVLWEDGDSSKFLQFFDLSQWLPAAKEKLGNLSSWRRYCQSFTSPIPEGTFAAARHYQLEASKTEQVDFGGGVVFSPKVHMTRSRTQLQPPIRQPDFTSTTPPRQLDQAFETPGIDYEPGSSPLDLPMSSPPSHWSTISPDDEFMYPPTKDEQITNTALLVFLDSITLHFNLSVSWSLHRIALTAEFTNAKFEARTDGYLADRNGDIKAIIEVKPVLRQMKEPQIRIQESHQIVAGLLTDYNSSFPARRNKPRIIISQDRHEIYISIAEYNADYINYLQTGDTRNNPFLVVHEFGPWNTNNPASMAELGPILLAISLKAQHY
ncbi:hypothetical protein ASPZODRAFT_131631 [Penicilliopsis zonata CBS 506.65]|uniref:Uncharacterized protein n=1 Tax=Penicilliopsis zonata CBS 506.65 TaxID=1073090 RepID=A0A1L9SL98_9EURO|nr:hypothetical protein ASPZODRAFT_131631 [Penicilliopsis zonata CBS 506.65]OJJ47989.1 hypothetical protein ASPZODRAFT_131631 [Penicilliopsis zonata CBS 506.65]